MYSAVLGQSPLIDDIISKMQKKVHFELQFQKQLLGLNGALEMVLAQVCLFGARYMRVLIRYFVGRSVTDDMISQSTCCALSNPAFSRCTRGASIQHSGYISLH